MSTLVANQKTAKEASQEPIQSPPTDDGNDQVWQTFLEHDPDVSEAVERLSSLSPRNVEEFRNLLLQHRDRTRVKEFEDEAIRRVQGPPFVGDTTLLQAYISLNREDGGLGDEFIRVVGVIGKPKDLERTVALVRAAAKVPPRVEDATAAYDRGDYATSLRLSRPLADQGNATAQNLLGSMYANGQGVPQNYINAYMWFSLAAAQGDQNAVKNRDLFEQRVMPAQIIEAQGLARERTVALVRKKFPAKGEAGIIVAQPAIVLQQPGQETFLEQKSEPTDPIIVAQPTPASDIPLNGEEEFASEQVDELIAADRARPPPLNRGAWVMWGVVGVIAVGAWVFLPSENVNRPVPRSTPVTASPLEDAQAAYRRRDYATALRLFRPLADQGNSASQTILGIMYRDGLGVSQNYAEAIANGQGVPQNYINAYMWFSLAAAQGNQDAVKGRDIAAQHMNPAQIAEAQKLAREWHSKKFTSPTAPAHPGQSFTSADIDRARAAVGLPPDPARQSGEPERK